MKHLKSINEEFMGIDLDKIKKKAYEYHKTKEWRDIMSGIDIPTLNLVDKEITFLKNKWGNIDNIAKKILNKGETKNETIFNTILLTAFGIHAFMKLLVALKNNRSFLRYLGSLFFSTYHNNNDIKTFRDLCISVVFCIYLIVFTISNNCYVPDYYVFGKDVLVVVKWKWSGLNNYLLKDDKGKEYFCKKTGNRRFDVSYRGVKIGTIYKDDFYNLSGEKILFDISDPEHSPTIVNTIDLEKLFKGNFNINVQKAKEIEKRNLQMRVLQHEIDSLKLTENVDQAKKIIKNLEMEYNELPKLIVKNPTTDIEIRRNNKIKVFLEIKDILEKNNNIGYLGLFATIIFRSESTYRQDILNLYTNIIKLNDVITQLRDSDGNLKPLLTFTSYEELNDALVRLKSWRSVNEFMRQIPAAQKNLIWKDRYFIEKNKSQFLTNCILKIYNSHELSKMFLRKVSSIKTAEAFISTLGNITNEISWDYDTWFKKLSSTKNVYITWSSKKENQIVCIVTTHSAIKKIAFMTNWCIYREMNYFYRYESKGLQCILYDFNYDKTENRSVIGFTTKFDGTITDCNDKSDYRTDLPSEFYETGNNRYHDKILQKYIKINWAKVLLKMDITSLKIIKKFLQAPLSPYLSKKIKSSERLSRFIDYYEED